MRLHLFGMGLALTAVLGGAAALVGVNAMATQTVQEKHTYPFLCRASQTASSTMLRSWSTARASAT